MVFLFGSRLLAIRQNSDACFGKCTTKYCPVIHSFAAVWIPLVNVQQGMPGKWGNSNRGSGCASREKSPGNDIDVLNC
jgi:hypothetical protein